MAVLPTSTFQKFIRIVLLVALFFTTNAQGVSEPPWERGTSRGEDLEIEIFTFGPGQSLEEWWGHIGLRIKDTRLRHETLYNWGMFTFDEQLIRNFITGRLRFWVAAEPVQPSLAFYERQGRIVHAIPLNLPPEKRVELANMIAQNMRPENREYDYEYLRDNCSTRIRDHINTLSNGSFQAEAASEKGHGSFRSLINIITAHNVGMNLLINFLLGSSVDKPNTKWDDMFLPMELENYLVQKNLGAAGSSAALVGPVKILHEGKIQYPTSPIRHFPFDAIAGFCFGACSLALAFLYQKRPRLAVILLSLQTAALGTTLGFLGSFLLFFNLFTWHTYTYWNENLFFANPITLALIPLAALAVRNKGGWAGLWIWRISALLAGTAVAGLAFKILPISNQDNWVFVRSVVPALFLTALAWTKIQCSRGSTTRKNVS